MALDDGRKRWIAAIFVVVTVWFMSVVIAGLASVFSSTSSMETGNVAIIPIKGMITTEESDSLFGEEVATSSSVIKMIDEADSNQLIKAIILEINSPGGTPVATDEISQRIKKLQKPNVAYIREIGTSGAYWVASSADYVIANRMSITGSIGVIGSYLEFSGLIERYNVSYERLVSGKYKDIGSPWKENSPEERMVLQTSIDLIGSYFIDEVAKNRNMTRERAATLATGQFYVGGEAIKLGLIDELGGKDEAIRYIENKTGIKAKTVEYKKKKGLLSMLSEATSSNAYQIGRGIGSSIVNSEIIRLR